MLNCPTNYDLIIKNCVPRNRNKLKFSMRILKNKVAQALAHKANSEQILIKNSKLNHQKKSVESRASTGKKRNRVVGSCFTPEGTRTTKNIVKNYGRAICKFTASSIAIPYLEEFLSRENVQHKKFINFVDKAKKSTNGLQHFRSVLLENVNDTSETAACKIIFRQISEVFIKYFSVNWIFHSKMLHKEAHLKFRFKMLRRIQNPELFTYLIGTKDANVNLSD